MWVVVVAVALAAMDSCLLSLCGCLLAVLSSSSFRVPSRQRSHCESKSAAAVYVDDVVLPQHGLHQVVVPLCQILLPDASHYVVGHTVL